MQNINNGFCIEWLSDSGIVNSCYCLNFPELPLRGNYNEYKGALFEKVIGEALVKGGYALYYYKREDSTLEEYFFVRKQNALVPVEVKTTNGTSKSLSILIRAKNIRKIYVIMGILR